MGNLPGADAQNQMASGQRRIAVSDAFNAKPHKVGAVLILLYAQNNGIFFPLTLRNRYKGIHSDQVSLPGGRAEIKDTSLEQTAVRETEEEIGIQQDKIKIIGRLTDLYIPPSNFHVHPFVGYLEEQPKMKKDDFEVAELFSCGIDTLLNENIVGETKIIGANGLRIKTPFYNIENKVVWGATAMILSELKAILKR